MDKNHSKLIFSQVQSKLKENESERKEQTGVKAKNTRSLPSAQQSKTEPGERRSRLFFALRKEANSEDTTAKITQTRKKQKIEDSRDIPSSLYQRPHTETQERFSSEEIWA